MPPFCQSDAPSVSLVSRDIVLIRAVSGRPDKPPGEVPSTGGRQSGGDRRGHLVGMVGADQDRAEALSLEAHPHGGLSAAHGHQRAFAGAAPGPDLPEAGQVKTGGAESAERRQRLGHRLDLPDGAQRHVDVAEQAADLLGGAQADGEGGGAQLQVSHALIILIDESVINLESGWSVALADLLLHPVRLRIVQSFLGDRILTTADLRAQLIDVPMSSLYRHVTLLADAGVLEVAEQRKVRGTEERSYRLVLRAASIGPEGAGRMTTEEHRRGFATFAAALLADFDHYLAQPDVDLARDGVSYLQVGVWLTDGEFTEMLAELRAVLAARTTHRPDGTRRRRLISTVTMPREAPPGAAG